MSAPTAPSLSTLVAEALKRAKIYSPASSLTTRAQDLWMEEIKNDILVIANGRKLKPLMTSSVTVTVQGKERYSNPTDYFSDMTMEILDGTKRGTATAGASGTITLQRDEGDIVGSQILITSGTGVGSMSQCTVFNTSTLVATVSPNFATAPDSTSGYMIVDSFYNLDETPLWLWESGTRGTPDKFYVLADSDYGEFILSPIPYTTDSHVLGIRMKYYANLMTLDLAGTLMATLYQRWRNIWLQGVYAKALKYELDSKDADKEIAEYQRLILNMVYRDAYGMDMSGLQGVVES